MRPLNRDSLPHLVRCAWELLRFGASTALARLGASWWGIRLGPGCGFYGAPVMRRLPGTRIVVGARCTFRSANWSNLAGINRPCILATVGEGAVLTIGDDCGFSGTAIGAAQSVTIGARVMAGVNTMISDTDWHPVDPASRAAGGLGASAPVTIGDDVWLGANVLVLKGARIGAGSSLAANSVVTGEIPPGVLAGGVPARVIRPLATT
jgi:acetyltransferase-like isoleucine patch superfamily enzyme